MLRNSHVSVFGFARKAVFPVLLALTLTFIGVVTIHASSSDTSSYNGTVGGVSWSAIDSIEISSGNGGFVYTGVSRTTATQGLTLNVSTTGRELCGRLIMDTDWGLNHTSVNSTSVSIGPVSGWAQAGLCWFIPSLKTTVTNYTYHQAVNGWQADETRIHASLQLPQSDVELP